jgi:hypothetical protein
VNPIADYSLGYRPDRKNANGQFINNPPASWGNFTEQQGSPRVMQFALRYDF